MRLKHSWETWGEEECRLSQFFWCQKKKPLTNKAEKEKWSLLVALSGITPVSSVHWGHFVWSSTTRSSDQPVHLELSYKLKEQHVASGDLFHLVVALYFCKVQHGSTGKQKANRNVAIRRQQTVRQMCGAADLILSALKASSRTDEETPLYSLEQITKIFTFASNYFCLFVCLFVFPSCHAWLQQRTNPEQKVTTRSASLVSSVLSPCHLLTSHQHCLFLTGVISSQTFSTQSRTSLSCLSSFFFKALLNHFCIFFFFLNDQCP